MNRVTLSFIAVVMVATAVLILLVWQISTTSDLTRDGQEAHDAICALRADVDRRRQASLQFLSENPRGIPGIPASVIRNGITNQEATLEALGGLEC